MLMTVLSLPGVAVSHEAQFVEDVSPLIPEASSAAGF